MKYFISKILGFNEILEQRYFDVFVSTIIYRPGSKKISFFYGFAVSQSPPSALRCIIVCLETIVLNWGLTGKQDWDQHEYQYP